MSHPSDRVPTHIGRFEVESVLGTGGMGAVYKAIDPTLKRTVAVKTVRPDISEQSYLQRLVAEAQACARLHHPHIVTVHEAGEIDGGVYVVMEYLEGEDLAQVLWRGELSFEARLRMLVQILDALEHAHGQGVVHRDIKPANIRVMPNGNVKIVDFGLARSSQVDTRTQTGTILGTLHYASPEQLRGEKVDGRSDIYSTGTMAYEMCSGRRPFDGDTISTIIIKVIQDPIPPMDAQWSRSFPEIERIITRAMAKNVADRYQSAGEMRDALTAFLAGSRERIASAVSSDAARTVLAPPASAPPVTQWTQGDAATGVVPRNASSPTATIPGAPPAPAPSAAAGPPSRSWLMPAAALVALSLVGVTSYVMLSGGSQAPDAPAGNLASAVPAEPAPAAPPPSASPASPPPASPAPANPVLDSSVRKEATPLTAKPDPARPTTAPIVPAPVPVAAMPAPAATASAMFYAASGADAANTGLRYRVTQQTKSGSEADVDLATATFHTGDKVRLSFESNVDGYLYVVQQGSSGRWSVLFPSPEINSGRNNVRRSEEYKVPDDGWWEFDSNPGVENLFVFFSREPMQTLPGFGKPVTKPEFLNASAVAELQNSIASRDLSYSRDSKAAMKAGNLIQASYVVNKTEFGKAVSASLALRHEP